MKKAVHKVNCFLLSEFDQYGDAHSELLFRLCLHGIGGGFQPIAFKQLDESLVALLGQLRCDGQAAQHLQIVLRRNFVQPAFTEDRNALASIY